MTTGPTWQCPACDTYNEAAAPACAVCEEARHPDPTVVAPAPAPAPETAGGQPPATDAATAAWGTPQWRCPACGARNPAHESVCAWCAARVPVATVTILPADAGAAVPAPRATTPGPATASGGRTVLGCGFLLLVATAVVVGLLLLIANLTSLTGPDSDSPPWVPDGSSTSPPSSSPSSSDQRPDQEPESDPAPEPSEGQSSPTPSSPSSSPSPSLSPSPSPSAGG
ncbi:zinc finger protein [Streptomyces sp. 4N509B]|uniref:zinc finger protein n=1 Tax=Streptomyces sp. 4N509B TaxID=3457413 RepID=UPI003FD4BF66